MFAETWIDVPIRATLQLHGARPNPSTGDVTASFVLPSRGKVTLELFDLAGRRVTGFREMELDAGSYVLPLARVSRPAPGVYLLRMGFGGQSLESRVIVVH
jgi:hypothetical protein